MILRVGNVVSRSAKLRPLAISPPFNGRSASLTNALETNGAFIDALLPDSRMAVAAINRAIRTSAFVAPCATTTFARLHSSVALAVDRGVLYFYGADVVRRPAAILQGHGRVGRQIARIAASFSPPARRVLSCRSAIGWFYLLGILEPIVRGFRPLSDVDVTRMPSQPDRRSSIEWLESLVPSDVAAEIAELLRVVRDIRIPGPVRPNPVLGGLGRITGSDGDWIAGDTLVELKCTVGGVKREHVAQLLCYYALDQLCPIPRAKFNFSSLALCLPRQRCTIAGTVDEWLSAFGGPARSDLPIFVRTWCADEGSFAQGGAT